MKFFDRMKYAYTLALAVTIVTLITTNFANPAGDALVGVLAISTLVMMRGETVTRKAEVRARYYQHRYREEITDKLGKLGYDTPYQRSENCQNATHFPYGCSPASPCTRPSVSHMSADDIEESQGC